MSDTLTDSGPGAELPLPGSLEAIVAADRAIGRAQAAKFRAVLAWLAARGIRPIEDVRASRLWDELACELRLARVGAEQLLFDAL